MAGRGRSSPSAAVRLMMVVGSFALLKLVTATTYRVPGWAVPTSANGLNFNDFATKNNFVVGDVLEFIYNKDAHNVISFQKEDNFNRCDVLDDDNKVFEATGNTSITLAKAGMKYYACQRGTHCQDGQKFSIMVADAPAGGAAAPGSNGSPTPSSTSSLAIHSAVSAAVVISAIAALL